MSLDFLKELRLSGFILYVRGDSGSDFLLAKRSKLLPRPGFKVDTLFAL